jgi:hypothetical protein
METTPANNAGANNQEERLWNYIDGTVTATEKTLIEKLLESSAEWQAKYRELLEVNKLLQSSEMEAPSMRFSKNVMEEISRLHIAPSTRSYINKKIILAIGFFFIAMFVGFLIYGIGQMNFTENEEGAISKNLSKFDFSKFFSNTWVNAFMMVNVVIGLFFLDNYLSNKRKEYRKS